MSYGRVISGGKQMTKGLTKGINDKLDQLEDKREKRETLANTVKGAFAQKDLSSPNWNDIQVNQPSTKFGGKKGTNMTSPKRPTNV